MKTKLIYFGVTAVLFAIGVAFGFIACKLNLGYYYKELHSKSYPFGEGDVKLKHAMEYVGAGILEPETSIIELNPAIGLTITIYKAQRGFQESSPHVSDLIVERSSIRWDDGINAFDLTVTPIQSAKD